MQLKELLRVIKSDENLLISDAHFGIDRLFDSKDHESALVFKTYVFCQLCLFRQCAESFGFAEKIRCHRAEKIAEIVAEAPEDFDTLKEMSDWIAGHEESAAAMNTAIQRLFLTSSRKPDIMQDYTARHIIYRIILTIPSETDTRSGLLM